MYRRDLVAFVSESIFDSAVLHHYRALFEVHNTVERRTYLISRDDLDCHEKGQSELWLALQDPQTAAYDLRGRERPKTPDDLGWKDRSYASPSRLHIQDESTSGRRDNVVEGGTPKA